MTTSTIRAATPRARSNRSVSAKLACVLLAGTALASPALAQSNSQPIYRHLDANGVDLTRGDFVLSLVEGSIGSGPAALALIRTGPGQGNADRSHQWDGISLEKSTDASGNAVITVNFGARSERFTATSDAAEANGSSLTALGAEYHHRSADGTLTIFGKPAGTAATSNFCSGDAAQATCRLLPLSMRAPDGKAVTIEWNIWSVCNADGSSCDYSARIARISNSFGYSIAFVHASEGTSGATSPPDSWYRRTKATFHNSTAGTAPLAQVSYAYPSPNVVAVTDMAGRVWQVSSDASRRVTGIRRPAASSDTTVISYDGTGLVSSVTNDGVTTSYSRSVSGTSATMAVTNALNQQTLVTSDVNLGRPTSVRDPLNRTTSFQYDGYGRLTGSTGPEGNSIRHARDARGNVTETRAIAKLGSGEADIVTTAAFPAECFNPVTCNSPASTTDPRGNVTYYEYDPTHGGLVRMTLPPTGYYQLRAQTRYTYTLLNGEYRLTGTSACAQDEYCTGLAGEVKTSLSYDANGNLVSSSTAAGDGSLTATQAMSYDGMGDLASVDGPLPGTADTTRYRYNAGREQVGSVSPDPDGGGPRKHRAVRNTYDASGRLAKVERGTVDSQSDADWLAMNPLESVETGYDDKGRPVTQKLVAGGATQSVTQIAFDLLGRPECTAQRMNPDAFGSLPPSACSLGSEGSFGPDRISRTVYDAAGQVTQVRSAVGTAMEAAVATSTYTATGKLQTITDGENNKTSYEYDGHDRLSGTLLPSPSKGSGTSNPNDYEIRKYDAASNLTSFRSPGSGEIQFSYDTLNRLTNKTLGSFGQYVSYQYDLLGRMTRAGAQHVGVSFKYDALGRKVAETLDGKGPISSTYDLAGRRTQITYPDNYYVAHDHLVTGEVASIRENGATAGIGVLARFDYDDLGRRTTLTRGNGTVTAYSYDPASRLSQLSHDMAGTGHDLTLGFSHNPAGEIKSATRSNDAYAHRGYVTGTRQSPANGLNQLVSDGGSAIEYDANRNVRVDPTTMALYPLSSVGYRYAYNAENQLTDVGGPSWNGTLRYDPLKRLYDAGAGTRTVFGHDGENRITEYHEGIPTLRVVHGPGVDEPLVTYDGTDLATRRWLHADERGSIVALSDDSGAVTNVNTYDEYGNGPSTNRSRFQFAGKPYETMSELYDSRARMYNPRLGRFMQPDPIGYGDGMNMYAYAHGDPVNGRDPFGTDSIFGPPSEEQLAALVAQEAERWKNYNPGPNTLSNEMAAYADAQARWAAVFSVVGEGYFTKANPGGCQGDPTCSAADKKWVQGSSVLLASATGPSLVNVGCDVMDPTCTPTTVGGYLYDSLVAGAKHYRDQAREILKRCLAGASNVDAGELAEDAAKGVPMGAARGAATGGMRGGWAGAASGAAVGAAKGAATGGIKSAVKQACA